jgi:hypothetical protein
MSAIGTAVERPELPHLPRLKPREERVLSAMLEGATVADAAAALRLHRRTVERVLARPQVAAAYRTARAALMAAAFVRLRRASGVAVETLMRVMGAPDAPGASVSAARVVLDMALRAVEAEDLLERIAALEGERRPRP